MLPQAISSYEKSESWVGTSGLMNSTLSSFGSWSPWSNVTTFTPIHVLSSFSYYLLARSCSSFGIGMWAIFSQSWACPFLLKLCWNLTLVFSQKVMKDVGGISWEKQESSWKAPASEGLFYVPPGKQRLFFFGKWLGAISASLESSGVFKSSKFWGLTTEISPFQVSGSHSFLGLSTISSNPRPDFQQSLPYSCPELQ